MIRHQFIQEPHAPARAPAFVDVAGARIHAGAGDVEMRPRRLVGDEALDELRRGDGATPARTAGVLHVGET